MSGGGRQVADQRTESIMFVVLVGPDGVGKTTVARHLINLHTGESIYFHFRPTAKGGIRPEPGMIRQPEIRRSNSTPVDRFVGWARILVNLARFWWGYLIVIRPALARHALVVGDRWSYGYMAKPESLGFYGPRWLARWVVALMPAPDLVAALSADPATIINRKPELDWTSAARDLAAWTNLPVRRLRVFDALKPPSEVAAAIRQCLRNSTG
jgi:thymidylate kinase